MSIVSVSLDEESIAALDRITESLGLKGRSDAVRVSIRSAMAEIKEMDDLSGLVEGVLIIVHEHHNDSWISVIQHQNEDIIKTQLHSHLQNRKCLELMIISGDGKRIRDMMHEIHSVGQATYLKFVRS
jgi:CopG family nickel-responsive transcriptional regulator